jgi:hypothetical protein
MVSHYNPIVRTFDQLKDVLSRMTDTPAEQIVPGESLEKLLPLEVRRALWRELRREGLDVPGLQLPSAFGLTAAGSVLLRTLTLTVLLRNLWALLTGLPLGVVTFLLTRPWAVRFPLGLRTAGELALWATRYSDHTDSGYNWTEEEIATKVRMVLAVSLNRQLDEIHMESTLDELGAE